MEKETEFEVLVNKQINKNVTIFFLFFIFNLIKNRSLVFLFVSFVSEQNSTFFVQNFCETKKYLTIEIISFF